MSSVPGRVEREASDTRTLERMAGRSLAEIWPYLCGKPVDDPNLATALSRGLGLSVASLIVPRNRRNVLRSGVLLMLAHSAGLARRTVFMLLNGKGNAGKRAAVMLEHATGVGADMWRDTRHNPLVTEYVRAKNRNVEEVRRGREA